MGYRIAPNFVNLLSTFLRIISKYTHPALSRPAQSQGDFCTQLVRYNSTKRGSGHLRLAIKSSRTRLFQTFAVIAPFLLTIGFGIYKKNAPLEVRSISYELGNSMARRDVFLFARTKTQRKRGLQHVESLDAHGLILVYPKPRIVKIWMRDTPLPLHILFLDEAGYVRSVQFGIPNSDDVISADVNTKYVVEIPTSKLNQHMDFVGAKFMID